MAPVRRDTQFSANWDARSLRLNFELSVEAYGRHLAEQLGKVIREKLRGARSDTG